MGAKEEVSAYITLRGPGHDGTRLPLREGITSFGRLPSNDVILLGDLVSRHHARITFFEGRATLQDLGSHNGSWVNGERVTTRVLRAGDVARIGNFRVDFHEGSFPGALSPSFDESTSGERDRDRERNRGRGLESSQGSARPTTRSISRDRHPETDEAAGIDSTESAQETDRRPPAAPSRQSGPVSGNLPAGYQSVPRGPIVDVIERAEESTGLGSEARALHLVCKASEALARAPGVDSYVREMLSVVTEEIETDLVAFYRVEEGQPILVEAHNRNRSTAKPEVVQEVLDWVVKKNFAVTSEDVSNDARFAHGDARRTSVMCVPVSDGEKVGAAIYLARGASAFSETEFEALSAIGHLSALGLSRAERKEVSHTRDTLAPFYAPDVLERLLAGREPEADVPPLEGKTATALVADVQGFNSSADRLEIHDVSRFLNAYVEEMSEIVTHHRGAIHHHLGTQLTATFGAPFSYGNDAARAVFAALDMRESLDTLVARFPAVGQRQLRVGVYSGWLLCGVIGSSRRLSYTTLGEPVVSAAKLEAGAAAGAVLIGDSTYPLVRDLFELRRLGLQQIRGKPQPIQVYEVLGRRKSV